jgi:UDP-GlcNAc:undecaprenyl-phosphate GlcNAc-1-phosphate transferase
VPVRVRLVFTMISAALGWWLLDGRLAYLDFAPLDPLLRSQVWAAFGMTLIAVSGVANAVNIVDGCNGLSSFVSMVALAALAVVGLRVGDGFVTLAATVGVAALFGFFVWNFPMGRIFMGDAGAYLTGFYIAELSILLVRHNPQVSPWFPMLVMAYPVWETLYSMYRRAFVHGSSIGRADSLHLHQLIYYRLVRVFRHSSEQSEQATRSSVTSAYLWVVCLMCAVPAVLFWDNSTVLKGFCIVLIGSYIVLHTSLVRFRSPRLLILRNWPFGRTAEEPEAAGEPEAARESES